MTLPEGWFELKDTRLPYEQRFKTMDWLGWNNTPNGGIISDVIIREESGNSLWLQQQLSKLGVGASIIYLKHDGIFQEGTSASKVYIPPVELQQLSYYSQDFTHEQKELLRILKLVPTARISMSR